MSMCRNRLIVVDANINGDGGHYLEYALSVLNAAHESGYKTVLVTGKGFNPSGSIGHEFLPICRRDFFGRVMQQTNNAASITEDRRTTAKSYWNRAIFNVVYIWFGLGVISSLRSLSVTVLRKTNLGQLIYRLTGRSILGNATMLGDAISSFAKTLSRWARYSPVREYLIKREIHKDCLAWVEKINIAKGDIVFIPTVAFRECEVLAKLFTKRPMAREAAWCLLFRRNLFHGSRINYVQTNTYKLRDVFEKLGESAAFYTDSQELRYQYKLCFKKEFVVLPIPHSRGHLARAERHGKIRFTYIGDARTEKGYPKLPDIVAICAADQELREEVSFTIQSNYNLGSGEPRCVVAKAVLHAQDQVPLKLLDDSQDKSGYEALLSNSDVGLLLYDESNYFARTSGVLIEYLSAGIPVIVPANTWLSREFEGMEHAYLKALIQRSTLVKECTVLLKSGNTENEQYSLIEKPTSANFCAIHLRSSAGSYFECNAQLEIKSPNGLVKTKIIKVSPNLESNALLRIYRIPSNHSSVTLRISSVLGNVPPDELSVDFYRCETQVFPIGAVGVVYDAISEIKECIHEVVAHWDHYKKTAIKNSEELAELHNAHRLVSLLGATTRKIYQSSV